MSCLTHLAMRQNIATRLFTPKKLVLAGCSYPNTTLFHKFGSILISWTGLSENWIYMSKIVQNLFCWKGHYIWPSPIFRPPKIGFAPNSTTFGVEKIPAVPALRPERARGALNFTLGSSLCLTRPEKPPDFELSWNGGTWYPQVIHL